MHTSAMPKVKNYPVFAISKCIVKNPLIDDWNCVEYTRHAVAQRMRDGKRSFFITDLVISKERALQLIKEHNMRVALKTPNGTIWDTTPSLKDECERLGLTYTHNRYDR